MNALIITGNLTKDPEMRDLKSGDRVCTFSVAVNERRGDGEKETIYFKVSAWKNLGERCHQYLSKGKKVLVMGAVRLNTWTGEDGQKSEMSITARNVEFLSPINSADPMAPAVARPQDFRKMMQTPQGFMQVEDDEPPF